ncbi:DNA-directed RNA polymerase subunit A' [archaeon]|jgi:DNA-directed RNA polymerase subunit A'|nr:DNA-directed RNA polymerase subunit A' [archaeon]MBT4351783.1 DNA-directed RNA polymerase subunit A' [archaeon]MBT4648563.1 DNA-directed RNA polymerase subunit A' [archaeon]MBT6822631.1 DNA-directed RNA polymerase subunit A' [archaeon]MBT7392665.1 DNA-directed RNA polymerase subunit A' [archaeon]
MEPEYIYKKIKSISFGVLSPKVIKDMSVAKVVTPELYDKEGYPVDGGLMDTRLGVIDPGLICKTDGLKLKDSLGHFGYIELARPVIHVKFVKNILAFLRGTCRECSRILLEDEDIEKYKSTVNKGKIKKVVVKEISVKVAKATKCPHCKEKQYKVKIEKPTTYLDNEKRISPIEIRTRFEKITDEDLILFGVNHKVVRPEWMILTLMAIPPVSMRPSITLESGERSEDDLTHKLGDIVRINQRLFENINAGAPEIIIEDLWDLLQYHITTFFDNSIAQIPPARHRSGQALKTITGRIKSKEGRIRHNLAGKRTNFSSRTVISPDSMIGLDEVGVPKQVAMKLSVPERITEENKEFMVKYIEKGPKSYPGANYIVRPDGKKKKITDETKEQLLEEIEPGYQVERHLLDGDIAIFNRQPSLHRMSMMCHKIRVLPFKTFRLNPAVCAPYNADFDGDEMNLHVPQTEEARAEAEILMQVQTQLISPRYGLGIIACNQDSIAGNYLLTREMEMDKKEAIRLLASIGVEDFSNLPNKDIITGKEVFSVLIPNDFSFNGKSRDGNKVIIHNGKIKEGTMDSANLGSGSGLLIRTLHKKYGPDVTIKILGLMFRLGIKTLLKNGFTVTLSDLDVGEKGTNEFQTILKDAESMVDELIKEFYDGKLVAFPGRSVEETLELKILGILNKARNDSGKVVLKTINKDAHTIVMSSSGARGNIINLAQMIAVVGQQAFRGQRIERGYTDRTLSCFEKKDLGPSARGFIRDGFKKGLRPHEFFFMAMTGRDSLMDTALRTPKSGYIYRRLSNALQDIKVEYDGTVRNAAGKIVQYKYGEDGVDVSKSEGGKINIQRIIEKVITE